MSIKAMSQFQQKLKNLMDEYAHLVYKITKKFPNEEIYSSCDQLKRATLSIALNYIEGFSRIRTAVQTNFYEISYGSLNESIYLLDFALKEEWISSIEANTAAVLSDEIGRMLWSEIQVAKISNKK